MPMYKQTPNTIECLKSPSRASFIRANWVVGYAKTSSTSRPQRCDGRQRMLAVGTSALVGRVRAPLPE